MRPSPGGVSAAWYQLSAFVLTIPQAVKYRIARGGDAGHTWTGGRGTRAARKMKHEIYIWVGILVRGIDLIQYAEMRQSMRHSALLCNVV
jgi:hypothetical protein